jgi:hypothetical protein
MPYPSRTFAPLANSVEHNLISPGKFHLQTDRSFRIELKLGDIDFESGCPKLILESPPCPLSFKSQTSARLTVQP